MKFKKILKILNIIFIAISLNFCSVVLASQSKEKIEEIENNVKENERLREKIIKKNNELYGDFDESKYSMEGYSLTVYWKLGIPILHYVHEKTKANIIIVPVKNKEQLKCLNDSIFFRARVNDDKGFVHYCEHLLSDGDYLKLIKKYSGIYGVNASTKREGLEFRVRSDFPYYVDFLKAVTKNLKSSEFLSKKEIFDREKKRIYYELKDIETGQIGDMIRNDDFDEFVSNRQYTPIGFATEAKKISRQEVVKFVKDEIHPSNMCAVKYAILNVKKVKECLKNLDELYLKFFKAKDVGKIKEKLKDKTPFKKIYWPHDAAILKQKKDGENKLTAYSNLARVVFFTSDLNMQFKKLFALMFNNGEQTKNKIILEELNKYVKTLGYDCIKINGLNLDNSKFIISLYSNRSKKCFEEKTLRKNINKILVFIKNKLKEMSDLELTKILSPVSFFVSKNLIDKSKDSLDDLRFLENFLIGSLAQKSFALYNEPFSNKTFNIDENNKFIESRESVIESVRNNLDVYDKLIAKGPKYIDYIIADKNVNYAEKFEYGYLAYNLPIKIKNYNNNKTLFYLASNYISNYFNECLGVENSLTHSRFSPAKYYGGPISISQACVESKNAVFDYINKNFDKIIKNYKITKTEFEEHKKEIKKICVEKLAEARLGMKRFKKFKKEVEMFLKGEENPKNKITNKLTIGDFIKLYHSVIETDLWCNSELFDASKDFVNELTKKDKTETFDKKYDNKEKINKQIVKDYVSSHMDIDYVNINNNLKFFEQMVKEIDSIQCKDVENAIKSAYLLKDKELEDLNKINKIWETKIKKERDNGLESMYF